MNSKLLPLVLLSESDGEKIEGITRFQKLVFLADQELFGGSDHYSFRPDKYGPFSPTLYDDLDRLVATGFIDVETERTFAGNEKQVYSLSEKGEKVLERTASDELDFEKEEIERITEDYNKDDLWDLLEYVYGQYPEFAENSKLNL